MNNKICQKCQSTFACKDPRQVFCSRRCAAQHNNSNKTGKCKRCGVQYLRDKEKSPTSKICKECKRTSQQETTNEIKKRTLGEYYAMSTKWASKHPQYKWNSVRNFCRRWNWKPNLKCEVCGYSAHIEYCHVRPIGSFPDTATLGEVNSPENVLILCPNHHWEQENGLQNAFEILAKRTIGREGIEPSTSL